MHPIQNLLKFGNLSNSLLQFFFKHISDWFKDGGVSLGDGLFKAHIQCVFEVLVAIEIEHMKWTTIIRYPKDSWPEFFAAFLVVE